VIQCSSSMSLFFEVSLEGGALPASRRIRRICTQLISRVLRGISWLLVASRGSSETPVFSIVTEFVVATRCHEMPRRTRQFEYKFYVFYVRQANLPTTRPRKKMTMTRAAAEVPTVELKAEFIPPKGWLQNKTIQKLFKQRIRAFSSCIHRQP
jgi:hypothetical protein